MTALLARLSYRTLVLAAVTIACLAAAIFAHTGRVYYWLASASRIACLAAAIFAHTTEPATAAAGYVAAGICATLIYTRRPESSK